MKRRYIRVPWKRNLRKVPGWIVAKAQDFPDDEIVVACVKRVSAWEVRARRYAHLGIELHGGDLQFPDKRMPNTAAGKYSRLNYFGYTLVRKDLPKITKTYSMEVPNFGDWSKGSHTVSMDREVTVGMRYLRSGPRLRSNCWRKRT